MKTVAEDPNLKGNHGIHYWECPIVINRAWLADCVYGRASVDEFIHTWVHESLHARGLASDLAILEYNQFPGYEEGVVDGLSRLVMKKLTKYERQEHPYDSYVAAMEGLAEALGMKPEELLRKLWAKEDLWVSKGVERAISHRGILGLRFESCPPWFSQ
ncbi:MAG: hypothetical protein KM310_11055 [Clostridiales bacterium]|nr:hypothetical protein [Clostridiales bacterium]